MRNKKFLIICLSILLLSGCSKKTSELDIEEMKEILKLSTYELQYENIAMLEKEKGSGILSLGEVDRKYWIQYTGKANIGVDMAKIDIIQIGKNITIDIPKAEILDIDIMTDKNSYKIYSSDDNFFNHNRITTEDQINLINKTQEDMVATIEKEDKYFIQARNRAKKLIAEYINKILGEESKEYNIKFK